MDIVIVIQYPTIYNLNYLILGFKLVLFSLSEKSLKSFFGDTLYIKILGQTKI